MIHAISANGVKTTIFPTHKPPAPSEVRGISQHGMIIFVTGKGLKYVGIILDKGFDIENNQILYGFYIGYIDDNRLGYGI